MKHSSPQFAAIAEQSTILRVQVGSGVHGTAIQGQDDRDEMGICVEPPGYVIGLDRFEQYIFRTQPEGHRSGPGDLDLIVYSLRKWVRLALQGNPTVLLPLFVPEDEIVEITDLGRELRAKPEIVLSRQAGMRFIGYLRSQRAGMLGNRRHTNRPELIEKYGFDAKYAMHMVRLGVQGVELLETGKITLPIPEPWLTWLRDLRQGKHTKDEALAAADELEAKLEKLITSSPLPERPDRDLANAWLQQAYQRVWAGPITR
ncbi:nucleotidyltransferase domain-containing protein [Kibdelosporangium philippinense]|uniref:Nucleotidyltransferase domain-containing protein n=1 Tax=Kibdelosporangium philippinense TaxID=211113 RepID=A0ABS8ZJK6_9PSEU|nr:nucleotidyltransferase domain-containing protein [Kibdelosporangium philippinense]MCE7007956.1 nucleotidyltransferase domain-containing protein [Kibdelosporangium philippinense]